MVYRRTGRNHQYSWSNPEFHHHFFTDPIRYAYCDPDVNTNTHRPHSHLNLYPNANPHSHLHANLYPDVDANTDENSYQREHTHAILYTDNYCHPDPNLYPNADANTDENADQHKHTYPNADAHNHGHPHLNFHPDIHSDKNADPHKHTYPNADANKHSYPHPNTSQNISPADIQVIPQETFECQGRSNNMSEAEWRRICLSAEDLPVFGPWGRLYV
jgi:hypothetical protein